MCHLVNEGTHTRTHARGQAATQPSFTKGDVMCHTVTRLKPPSDPHSGAASSLGHALTHTRAQIPLHTRANPPPHRVQRGHVAPRRRSLSCQTAGRRSRPPEKAPRLDAGSEHVHARTCVFPCWRRRSGHGEQTSPSADDPRCSEGAPVTGASARLKASDAIFTKSAGA